MKRLSEEAEAVLLWMYDAERTPIPSRVAAMQWGPTFVAALVADDTVATEGAARRALLELEVTGMVGCKWTRTDQ